MRRVNSTFNVTIANGEALSDSIDFRAVAFGVLTMPAAWTSAAIAFQVSNDNSTFLPLEDSAGDLIELTVEVDMAYPLPAELAGAAYVKVWSENAGSDEDQGAARTIGISVKA